MKSLQFNARTAKNASKSSVGTVVAPTDECMHPGTLELGLGSALEAIHP